MTEEAASDMGELACSGPMGLRYDFNDGCRVDVPPGPWRLRVEDLETASVLFDQAMREGGRFQTRKRYYMRFVIRAWYEDVPVFEHVFDLGGRVVLVDMQPGGIGDQLAWTPHAFAFARRHGCRLVCTVRADMVPLLGPANPDVVFVTRREEVPEVPYATYKVLIFYNDHECDYQPTDYRETGLALTGASILGLAAVERRPAIAVDAGGPPIDGPYVCISVQATSQNKVWNNPYGWHGVVSCLREAGYRVVCIDRDRVHGRDLVWNHIPHGVEDETGARPLSERARWLRHASFFIGVSSGLSWLAWAAGVPVVLISGFTHPRNEFETPYRVINRNVCNSCANDVRLQFDPSDAFWCPRQGETPRMFECSKQINPEHVIRVMEPLLGR